MGNNLMIKLSKILAGYQQCAVTPPISGIFQPGSMTALIGANGCGKSTLLKTLAGLLPPVSGQLELNRSGLNIAWLPQQSEIEKQFPVSVFDLVAMGCWRHCGWFGAVDRQGRDKVLRALQQVGMGEFAGAQPGTLSGGQLQRVLFARLLAQDAELLLLDEPFTGIDGATTQLLLALLQERHRAGCTLIVVLHDMQMVDKFFPQILRLGPIEAEWIKHSRVAGALESPCS